MKLKLGLTLLLMSGWVWANGDPSNAELSSADSVTSVAAQPFASLQRSLSYSAPAEVVNYSHSYLSAQVGAEIAEMRIRPGDVVAKGDVLVRLDCGDLTRARDQTQAQYSSTVSDLAFAKARLERAKVLAKKSYLSKDESEQRESDLARLKYVAASNKVALEQAKVNVNRCVITAPFDGVITEVTASERSMAGVGTQLLRLLKLQLPEVEAKVKESDLWSFTAAQPKRVDFVYLEQRVPLDYRSHAAVTDGASSMRRVYFVSPVAVPELMTSVGAVGRIEWQGDSSYIAPEHLVKRDGQLGVMVVAGSNAKFVPIEGAQAGRLAALSLPRDTLIIIKGQQGLKDGDPITLQEAENAQALTE